MSIEDTDQPDFEQSGFEKPDFEIQLAEHFHATPDRLWQIAPQLGVTHAVTSIPEGPNDPPPWELQTLLDLKQRFRDAGLDLVVIESAPACIQEPIKLGLENRDACIGHFCELIANMGRAGIPVICHNWMAGLGWLRTDMALAGRGGALVTGYDHAKLADAPLTEWGEISEDALWTNMEEFLRRVVPIAEQAGVKLAVHPDDPPRSPIRGIGRILTNPDAFQRVIDTVPSPNNGITFCQGNFSAMGADVPAEIRRFGAQGKIHFVHFRDVRGTPDSFVETFHDEGQTDMVAAIRAYADVGYRGPMRPDHVPTLAGEENGAPGYELLGRLYALGYIKGLIESAAHE